MKSLVLRNKVTAVILTVALATVALPFTASNSQAALNVGVYSASRQVNDQLYYELCDLYDSASAFLSMHADELPFDVRGSLESARSLGLQAFESDKDLDYSTAINNIKISLSVAEAYLRGVSAAPDYAYQHVTGTNGANNQGVTGVSADAANHVAAVYASHRNIPYTMLRDVVLGDFVDRLYVNILGRGVEDAGRDYWVNGIKSGEFTRDSVALTILQSAEFTGKNLSNEQYVTVLYQAFLGRTPDAQGLSNWVNALNNGASRQDVASGFAHSTEWNNFCALYGL